MLLNGTEYARLGDLYIVQGANPQGSAICQYICIIYSLLYTQVWGSKENSKQT